jgi:glycine/D-amino acid oxidase-like deaminating enzyme
MKEYPYWWDTVRAPLEQGTGSPKPRMLPRSPDVVVVGAGYTGLAAARQLARAGAVVAVLDKARIGFGASSRNGGQVLTGLKVDAGTLLARYGETRARQLFEVAGRSIARLEALVAEEHIDCEYSRVGHIQAAWKAKHFTAFRSEQSLLARVFGHRVELVSRSEQRSEIGSDMYHGLLVDEGSGALNPMKYVQGLSDAALRAGVTLIHDVAVTGVRRRGEYWAVATGQGEIEARDVLFATNGYSDSAAPALQRRLIPIGSFIVATEPLPAAQADSLLPRRRMAFDSKNFLYYFRVTSDSRLLFGGRAEFSAPGPETTRHAAAILRTGLTTVFPELASARIDYAWSGRVAFTPDEMPRAGRLQGAYYAGGYCGHGIAMATHLGEQIARRMAGETVAHPFFDDNWAPIPLYRGNPWFLPLVGAYYQVKDWLQ